MFVGLVKIRVEESNLVYWFLFFFLDCLVNFFFVDISVYIVDYMFLKNDGIGVLKVWLVLVIYDILIWGELSY